MGLPLFLARGESALAAPREADVSDVVVSQKSLPVNVRVGDTASFRATSRLRMVVGPNAAPSHARGREAIALLLWTAALFVSLALWSFEGDPLAVAGGQVTSTGPNWVGPVGEAVARALVSGIGLVAWSLPFEAMLLGIPLVRNKPSVLTPARFAGDLLILLTASALIQVGWPALHSFGAYPASGMVGELFGELSRSLFSTIGSFIVGFAILGLILIGRAAFSFIALMTFLADFGARGARGTAAGARNVAEAWRTAREIERDRAEQERLAAEPRIDLDRHDEATIAVLPPDEALSSALVETETEAEAGAPKRSRRQRKAAPADRVEKGDKVEEPAPEANAKAELDAEELKEKSKRKKPVQLPLPKPIGEDEPALDVAPEPAPSPARGSEPAADPVSGPESEAKTPRKKKPAEPTIVDTSSVLKKEAVRDRERAQPAAPTAFHLPRMDFLIPAKIEPGAHVDKETLFKSAELLVKTLADYGVSGKVEDILPGPTVTTFEVSPAAGTKVSKVASLADDLALALARKVRIVAPIPGKNRIGFELPNERRIPVSLRDLIEDRRFQTLDAPLPVVLGRDIVGAPVYADLASMPHVIVAGATGAGKSVGLNVMLTSLLFRRTPEELRLLMIDPKVVELAPFDRIPHMLLPVVTDMKQASNALKWAVDEMERRYQLFADAGTKNISTYNNWVDRVVRGEIKNPNAKTVIAKDLNGLEEEIPAGPSEEAEGTAPLPERLPFIVIVVDEFADLMMQQGKEVEAAVARLAQKARAAGMHVILATQRPSVDVITGMIKANFPTRIAYRVAQKVDSRTILDEQGAEHLLGRGDMLIKLNGTNETKRVQCPMITEEEVQAVTDFLRTQGEPVYDENILKPRDDEAPAEAEDDAEQDPLYDDAVRLVADSRRCSTSWLQRKLGLGYNRAARIVEMMERRGLVGPANGAKDREVLIESI
jgi:S-DNA-T family DNA segregation ATPase FtsK/SpoIIIE